MATLESSHKTHCMEQNMINLFMLVYNLVAKLFEVCSSLSLSPYSNTVVVLNCIRVRDSALETLFEAFLTFI